MSFGPSRPRPGARRAQRGALPPSPTPLPPPSWRSARRLRQGAPRPATSQSPHPRPTDSPRPAQMDARVHQQRPCTATNPRYQPTYSTCLATAATTSPNQTPRWRPWRIPASQHPPAPPLPAHPHSTGLQGIPQARHRHQSSPPHHTHPGPLLHQRPRPRPGTVVAALDPHAALGAAKVGPSRALARGSGPGAPQGVGGELPPPAGMGVGCRRPYGK